MSFNKHNSYTQNQDSYSEFEIKSETNYITEDINGELDLNQTVEFAIDGIENEYNTELLLEEVVNEVTNNPEKYINKTLIVGSVKYEVKLNGKQDIIIQELKVSYTCNICLRNFNHATSYTKHYAEIHGQKIFVCRQCPECFYVLTDLFLHARRTHVDVKKDAKDPNQYKFHCSQCSYMTNNGGTFEHHTRAHSGEKPFKCDICGKSFSQKTNMKTHRSRHVSTKMFPCTLCNKSFKTHDIYLSHLRTREHELREHVNESANTAMNIACLGCNEHFTKIFNIQNHLKVCADQRLEFVFRCLDCRVNLASIDDLKQHIKAHRDTRLISCPICNEQGFDQYNKLNHHITRLHGLKVTRKNVCRYCEITFEKTTELKSHITEYHNDEVNTRKSRGAMGRFRCEYEQCMFTATTQMLLESHYDKHERGVMDAVKPEPKKRGRKPKLHDCLDNAEGGIKVEVTETTMVSEVCKKKRGRPLKIGNILESVLTEEMIKEEQIDSIVNDYYD